MRTAQGATDRWNASVQDLNITFGTALLPVLNDVLDKEIPVIGAIGQWVEANPELAATLATVAGSLIAVRGAVATLRFVGLLGKGGALSLLSGGPKSISLIAGPVAKGLQVVRAGLIALRVSSAIGGLGPTLLMVGRAALGLLNPFRLVGLAIRGIGAALAATPVGAVVAAIAAGAYLLYKHWGEVGPWFGRLWGNVKQAFSGASEFIIGICTLDFGRAYDGLVSYWTGLGEIFKTIWDGICTTFTAAWTDIIAPILDQFGLLEPVKTAWAGLLAFLDPLLTKIGDVFKAVWAWIKPVIDGLKWVMDNGAAAADRVSSFRAGNSAPGGGADAMADGILGAPGYAVGGSFRRGPIMVGERGPELRYEDRSGFIAHNRQLVGMARNAARIAALGGALGTAPLAALPIEDISAPMPRHAGASDRTDRSAPINVGDIHIHAQPGQDPRAIADAVLRELDRRSRGALFDGGS
ncbi:phage tail tape measure protein [Paracoccus yeei]|uniref:phage tail tape measure protein n=1 Tax=Paracoccus yeei TaxID=147645 RepID=UPI0028D268D5|nr:phage tail tape measure protein [Paracoccus yeei]